MNRLKFVKFTILLITSIKQSTVQGLEDTLRRQNIPTIIELTLLRKRWTNKLADELKCDKGSPGGEYCVFPKSPKSW